MEVYEAALTNLESIVFLYPHGAYVLFVHFEYRAAQILELEMTGDGDKFTKVFDCHEMRLLYNTHSSIIRFFI